MTELREWCVVVGTRMNTEHADHPDSAGLDVWGPYTKDEAEAVWQDVNEVWDNEPAKHFVYGVPFAEVRAMKTSSHPFYNPGAVAAANWYRDPATEA